MKCLEVVRRLQPIRDEFTVRFYRWSLKKSKAEIESDFLLVRRVMGIAAFGFVEFMEHIDPSARARVGQALVKRWHKRAVELTGEFPDSVEDEIWQTYDSYFDITKPELEKAFPGARGRRMPGRAEVLVGKMASSPKDFDLDTIALKKLITSKLAPLFGQPSVLCDHPLGWTYHTRVGDWYVETTIDIRKGTQLAYSHDILARLGKDNCPSSLSRGFSLLKWVGAWPHTEWDLLTKPLMEEAVETLAAACQQFWDAVPTLLAGLRHNIPQYVEVEAEGFPPLL